MIRIQRLKEPKEGLSGEKVSPGDSIAFKGVKIENNNNFDVYVSWYVRKDAKANKKQLSKRR